MRPRGAIAFATLPDIYQQVRHNRSGDWGDTK